MLRLDYFDCISPLPLTLVQIGSIKSPTLMNIAEISYSTYSQYIAHIRMTPEDYFEVYCKDEDIDTEKIFNMTKFDLLLIDDRFRKIITSAINFFFVEDFEFYPEYDAFIFEQKNEHGEVVNIKAITRQNYSDVLDVVLQRVHITPDENEIDDINIKATSFPKAFTVYGDTYMKTTDDDILPYLFKAYKAVPQSNMSLSFANNGDPGTVTITCDLMTDDDGNIIDLTLLPEEENQGE